MLYILAVEDDNDIRDLYEISLSRTFPHEIALAASSVQAIEIIKQRGRPEVIICDDKMPDGDGRYLLDWMRSRDLEVPFILCSATPHAELKVKYPEAYGFVPKPRVSVPLQEMITDILSGQKSLLSYVPVSIQLLLRMGKIDFNLFMKLSYSNYVKVLSEGDSFITSDAERFQQKQITHLHVTAPDAVKFLENFENNLDLVMNSAMATTEESFIISMESLEAIERIGATLGWTPKLMGSAKKSVALAAKAIAREPSILKIFKQKGKAGSPYSRHVTLLSMVTCCICQQLGWTSESTQLKLAIAALMHDLAVDDEVYMGLPHWNECARNPRALDPETMRYRAHPVEAVTMLRAFKDLPADIDHIILQHHENPEGSGFPYKIAGSKVVPMACVFIVAEDLVNYMKEDSIEASVRSFIESREVKYQTGMFKKIFKVLKENIQSFT